MMKKALIFANGSLNEGPMVRSALEAGHMACVIAADGGVRNARACGLQPDLVIGDMDSLSDDELATLEASGVTLQRHPPAKDETDLELALYWAIEQDFTWIRIIGAQGGRFDQTLANVYLLTLPQLADRDVAMLAGSQTTRVLRPGTWLLQGHAGDTVSLLPLTSEVRGIRSEGLQYPLAGESLVLGPARGVSNVMQASEASIAHESGLMILVHTLGRA